MLTNVTWPDNSCTVGYTSIHFYTDSRADIEEMLDFCTDGSFIATFYNPSVGVTGFKNKEDLRYFVLEGRPRGFYFNFKLDEKGWAFLATLRLRGFTLIRKSGPNERDIF